MGFYRGVGWSSSPKSSGIKKQHENKTQYGLQHQVTNTIHGAQGLTLHKMETEISSADPDFHIWDEGQLIVILTRNKFAK